MSNLNSTDHRPIEDNPVSFCCCPWLSFQELKSPTSGAGAGLLGADGAAATSNALNLLLPELVGGQGFREADRCQTCQLVAFVDKADKIGRDPLCKDLVPQLTPDLQSSTSSACTALL